MKIFRSSLALFLALVLSLSFVGCGYSPVKSSEEELAQVLTFSDGAFSVPYEQYRFFFLSELALAEADTANMNEAQKAALFDEINTKVLEELAAVYAVLSLAKAESLALDDKPAKKAMKEDVAQMVEELGGGDFDTYLDQLGKTYMNDSVCRFLLHYRYAEALLGAHMRDTGKIASDRSTVLAYMNSEECVRVSWIYIPYTVLDGYTQAQLTDMEARAKAASDEDFLKMTHTVLPDTYTDAELDRGFYLGKYQLDPYYEALTDAVFSLKLGETSGWVHAADGVYLVRRLPKVQSYLNEEKNLADFTEYYLLNAFYQRLAEEASALLATVRYAELHGSLTLDTVKMPD